MSVNVSNVQYCKIFIQTELFKMSITEKNTKISINVVQIYTKHPFKQ